MSMTIKEWYFSQSVRDISQLVRIVKAKPIIGYTPSAIVHQPRDAWTVRLEKFVLDSLSSLSLTPSATPSQIQDAIDAAYNDAGTVAAKSNVVRKEAKFWAAYAVIRTLDVTGSATEMIETGLQPIYGQSIEEENGWNLGEFPGNALEEAIRG